tara:strand:+ start:2388 stop:4025 length:1638 start_codon:yes stop_codon:yes gene_type:complete
MSKTIFNKSTFQSKTLQNSNNIDIGSSNVTNFTAINATITNLTNSELQTATANIATKEPLINVNNRLNATLIGANGDVTNTEYGFLSAVTSSIQSQIDAKEPIIDSNNRLNANVIGGGAVSNGEFNRLNGTTSNIQTQLNQKQTELDEHDTLDAGFIGAANVNNTEYGFLDGVTSSIQTQIDAKEDIIDSDNRLNANLIGSNGNVSNTEYGFLNGVTSGIQGQLTTLQNATTGLSYASPTTSLSQSLIIESSADPQLLITRSNAGDSSLEIRSKRNNNAGRIVSLDFQNSDAQLASPIGNLGSIVGRVTNTATNVGGLEIVNYADNSTPSTALLMTHNGNFSLGTGASFQDDYDLSVGGAVNVGNFFHIPHMQIFNFDKSRVEAATWGNGSKQPTLTSDRTSGVAFCTHLNGVITFSSAGSYKIKASGNLQNVNYNDRLTFAIYLATFDSSNDPVSPDYFQNEDFNFFSWLSVGNNTTNAQGTTYFEDILYIPASTVAGEVKSIQIRNKLDTDSRAFDNTLAQSNLNCYLHIQITKLTDQNIFSV